MILGSEKTVKSREWVPPRRPAQTEAERKEEIKRQAIKDARHAAKGIRHFLEEGVESTPGRTDGRVGKRRG